MTPAASGLRVPCDQLPHVPTVTLPHHGKLPSSETWELSLALALLLLTSSSR